MRTSSLIPWTLLGVFALSPIALAQDIIAPGFARTAQQPVPVQGAAYTTLSTGERVVFDGLTVDLYDAAGGFLANLGSLPGFVFPSFVALNSSETAVLIGESSNNDLFRVEIGGGGLAFVTNLVFNYDAVFLDDITAVVSAATCGFGCGNDLVRVNVRTGATQNMILVPGASGPLAIGANGDLFYTVVSGAFPPPPGSAQVVRWPAALVHSGAPLHMGDAQVVVPALDGGASMDVDHVLGGIVVAESVWGGTSKIRLYSANGGLLSTVVTSQAYLSSVELRSGGSLGHFYPYQPANGVYLEYAASGSIRTVRPQRPQASISQLGAAVTVTVQGAPANGGMLVMWTSQAAWNPVQSSHFIGGLGFQVHSGAAPTAMRRLPFLMPADANGTATFSYFDGGNLAGTMVFQTLVMDASGRFVGSSTPVFN